jgi:hypothetical protein
MSGRPDIELALNVRSYEKVIVIADHGSMYRYPEHWVKLSKLSDLDEMSLGGNEMYRIDPQYPLAMTVVVVDRIEIKRRTLTQLASRYPRLIAFAVANVDHEKQVRRMITSLFPWSEVWTFYTSFGKLLVTKDVVGTVYDRDRIVDMREGIAA